MMKSLIRRRGVLTEKMTMFNILLLVTSIIIPGLGQQMPSEEVTAASPTFSSKLEKRLAAVEEVMLETNMMVQQMKKSLQSLQQVESLLVLFLEEILLSVIDSRPSGQSAGGESSEEAVGGVDSAETTDTEDEDAGPSEQLVHHDPLDGLLLATAQPRDVNLALQALLQKRTNLNINSVTTKPRTANNAMASGLWRKCSEASQNLLPPPDLLPGKDLHQAPLSLELLPMMMSSQGDKGVMEGLSSAKNQHSLQNTPGAPLDVMAIHKSKDREEKLGNFSKPARQPQRVGHTDSKAIQPADMEGYPRPGNDNQSTGNGRLIPSEELSLHMYEQSAAYNQTMQDFMQASEHPRGSRNVKTEPSSQYSLFSSNTSSISSHYSDDYDEEEDMAKAIEDDITKQPSVQLNSQEEGNHRDSSIKDDSSLPADSRQVDYHDDSLPKYPEGSRNESDSLQNKWPEGNQGGSSIAGNRRLTPLPENPKQTISSSESSELHEVAERSEVGEDMIQDDKTSSFYADVHHADNSNDNDNVSSREDIGDETSMQASTSKENDDNRFADVSEHTKMYYDEMPDVSAENKEPGKVASALNSDQQDMHGGGSNDHDKDVSGPADSSSHDKDVSGPADPSSHVNRASTEDADEKNNSEGGDAESASPDVDSMANRGHFMDLHTGHTEYTSRKKRQSVDDVLLYLLDDWVTKESNKTTLTTQLNALLQKFRDQQQQQLLANDTTGNHSNTETSNRSDKTPTAGGQGEQTNSGDDETVTTLSYSTGTHSVDESDNDTETGVNSLQNITSATESRKHNFLSTDWPEPSDQNRQNHGNNSDNNVDEASRSHQNGLKLHTPDSTRPSHKPSNDKSSESQTGHNKKAQDKLDASNQKGDNGYLRAHNSDDTRADASSTSPGNLPDTTAGSSNGGEDILATRTAEGDADSSKTIDEEDDDISSQQASSQESTESKVNMRLRRSPFLHNFAIYSRRNKSGNERMVSYALNAQAREIRSIQHYSPQTSTSVGQVSQTDPMTADQKPTNSKPMLAGFWNSAAQQQASLPGGRDALGEESGHHMSGTKRFLTTFLLALFGTHTHHGNGEEVETEEQEEQAAEDSSTALTPLQQPKNVQTLQESFVRFWKLLTSAGEDLTTTTPTASTSPVAQETSISSESESTSSSPLASSFSSEVTERQINIH